jgi:Flp pilus assembly protein TadG
MIRVKYVRASLRRLQTHSRADDADVGRSFFGRLIFADKGSAAVEMAVIIPLFVILMLATVELYMYVRAVSEVEHTAFTIADVLGQQTQIINSSATDNPVNLGSIWADAVVLAAPLSLATNGTVMITSICDATTAPCGKVAATNSMAAGTPQIYWRAQSPWNGSAITASAEQTGSLLPTTWPFRNGDSAIVVEVAYTYNPFPMTQALWPHTPGITTIYKRVYVRSRSSSPLTLVSP